MKVIVSDPISDDGLNIFYKKEENNEDPQSNPIQENPRKNRKKRRRK